MARPCTPVGAINSANGWKKLPPRFGIDKAGQSLKQRLYGKGGIRLPSGKRQTERQQVRLDISG